MELQELMNLINGKWSFDPRNYSALKGKTEKEIARFAVQYIVKRHKKALGEISEITEQWDHGKEAGLSQTSVLRNSTVKLLKNTLRLAEIIGLKADEIIEICSK